MSANKVNIDTTILPVDVLSFMDNKFYDLVQELTSENEAMLLEIQQINNANAFLLTKDPLEFIDLNSPTVEEMKKKVSFELSDGTYIIKPGIRANLQYLTNLFNKKVEEHQKHVKRELQKLEPTPEATIIDQEDDVKLSVVQSIKRWCNENKENFGLKEFQLKNQSILFSI